MSLPIINNKGPQPTHITTPSPSPSSIGIMYYIRSHNTHNYYQRPTQVLPRTPPLQVLELCIVLCLPIDHYYQPKVTTNPFQVLELCIVLDQAIYQNNPISCDHHPNHKYWNYVLYWTTPKHHYYHFSHLPTHEL